MLVHIPGSSHPKVLQEYCMFVSKITKRSDDPEYSVTTKPADSPDQTAPLGANCHGIFHLLM